MLIDCQTCIARDIACRDCVVTVLLQIPELPASPERREVPEAASAPRDGEAALELDDDVRAAIGSLASAGLVPPLRLVSGLSGIDQEIA